MKKTSPSRTCGFGWIKIKLELSLALLLWTLVADADATDAVTVRVQPTRGGPQIHINGKPVPPRFFFGVPSAGSITIDEQWSDHAFEFTPSADVKAAGTLHFRFGQLAGEVWLADVRITDAETGKDVMSPGIFAAAQAFNEVWNLWPPGEKNTVGQVAATNRMLHVKLTNPPNGTWPDFHLNSHLGLSFSANRKYRVTFRAKATPKRQLHPAVYQVSNGEYLNIGGPPGPLLAQVALARDAGVNLVSFSAPNCWAPPEQPQDWRALDDLCRQIIAVNPKVLLVPRVSAYAPDWWLRQHPEALMIYDTNQPGHFASVSHRGYRTDAAAHLEKLCRHLTITFPDHFAGVHPCGQNTGEWFYEGSWERPLSGYDPATREAFRAWLKAGGDADFATAEPPTADERRAHPNGFLRDPARERRLIEFARFQQREMADMVLTLAAAARRGSDGKKLVVFFYGYQFEFPPLANGAPTSGHYALAPVLKSKDIDILCSPISYFDREWLGTAPCMSPAESVRNAGILWLNEDDSRTHLDKRTVEHAQEGGLVNLRQTQQVMLRNTAQAALRGFGTWWMDLPGAGWFNDAAIWEEQKHLMPVERALLKRARPFTPEIAAIVGEDSFCHLTGGSSIAAKPLIYDARAALGRCGAPYGQFTLTDALAGKVPAKLQIFLAVWSLTSDERCALTAHRPPNTTRVWCYAPGYLLPDRADIAAMNEVTGFKHRAVSPGSAEATPTEAGRKVGLTKPWGPKEPILPLFTVEADSAETLAVYKDGSPAVAMRRRLRGLDIFLGVPALTPELVRAFARMSDVHLFTEENAAVWAAEEFLSIQAHKTGPLVIQTGRTSAVSDALTGAKLGRGPCLTLPMETGEVRVLRY
ncbi:MAG: beta-galactosidase [Verrucomicrobia bacterium]|nr:beta-galactosidase [Verrucomicrobiota bacterium]